MSDDEHKKFDLRILLACSGIVIAGLSVVATMAVKLYQIEENRIYIKENRSSINQVKDQVNHLKTMFVISRVPNDDVIGGE